MVGAGFQKSHTTQIKPTDRQNSERTSAVDNPEKAMVSSNSDLFLNQFDASQIEKTMQEARMNILVHSSTAMLAQANQNPDTVLSLLQ